MSSSQRLSPCVIRRARKNDLDKVLEVVLSSMHSRSVDLIPVVGTNLMVVLTAFFVCTTALVLMIFYSFAYDLGILLRTYIFGSVLPGLLLYLVYYISARNLYVDCRFGFYEALQYALNAYKKQNADNSDAKMPEALEYFYKVRQIYLAFPHKKEKDKHIEIEGPPLGVICVTPYLTWCNDRKVRLKMPLGFERYSHSAVMISEAHVNEQIIEKDDDVCNVFEALLQFVCGGSVVDEDFSGCGAMHGTHINYCVICVDAMMDECLSATHENGFTLCGKFQDMSLHFWIFGKHSFPSSFLYYIKPMNVVAMELREARLKRLAMEKRKNAQKLADKLAPKKADKSEKKKKRGKAKKAKEKRVIDEDTKEVEAKPEAQFPTESKKDR